MHETTLIMRECNINSSEYLEKSIVSICVAAAHAFQCPVAFFSYSDQNFLRLINSAGLCGNDGTLITSIEKTNSLFSWMNLEPHQSAIIINDATQHNTLSCNELVAGSPFIRFYAGAPVRVHGICVGALSVTDFISHEHIPNGIVSELKCLSDSLSSLLSFSRETSLRALKLVKDMLQDVRTPLTSIRYEASFINKHSREICVNIDKMPASDPNRTHRIELTRALANISSSIDQLTSNIDCYEIYRRAIALRACLPELCSCNLSRILGSTADLFTSHRKGMEKYFNVTYNKTKFDQLKHVSFPDALKLLLVAVGKELLLRWASVQVHAYLSPNSSRIEVIPAEYSTDYLPVDLVLRFNSSSPKVDKDSSATDSNSYLSKSIEAILSVIPNSTSSRACQQRGFGVAEGDDDVPRDSDQFEYRVPCLVASMYASALPLSSPCSSSSLVSLEEMKIPDNVRSLLLDLRYYRPNSPCLALIHC